MGKKKAEKQAPVKKDVVVKQDKSEKPVASRTGREKTKENETKELTSKEKEKVALAVLKKNKGKPIKWELVVGNGIPTKPMGGNVSMCPQCDAINPSIKVLCGSCQIALYDFSVRFKTLNKRLLDAIKGGDKDLIVMLKGRIEKDVKSTYGIYKVAGDGTAVRMKTTTVSEDGQVVSKKREPGAPRVGKVMIGYGHGQGTQGAAIDAAVANGGTIEDIAKAAGISKGRAKAHIAHLIKDHSNVKIEIIKNKYVAKEIKA